MRQDKGNGESTAVVKLNIDKYRDSLLTISMVNTTSQYGGRLLLLTIIKVVVTVIVIYWCGIIIDSNFDNKTTRQFRK